MLGICTDCRKPKNVNLPSHYDPKWLTYNRPSIEWRCKECYWKAVSNMTGEAMQKAVSDMTGEPTQIEIRKTYLMPYSSVIPFLSTIAFIIMTCLEIAWHS